MTIRSMIAAATAFTALFAASPSPASAATPASGTQADQYLIFVTMDGLRWQDMVRGADTDIVADKAQTERVDWVRRAFVDVPNRAKALMPFITAIPSRGGAIIGNRDAGDCMRVANPYWFSYPGYSELLTGFVDPRMNTNEPVPNPNRTVLEWLNRDTPYKGSVRALSQWQTFHAILNDRRSGIPVNGGVEPMAGDDPVLVSLAQVQDDLPKLWGDGERFDAISQAYARYVQRELKPHVLFVSYGETDAHAHEGRYDKYLEAAHLTDRFIRELWDRAQADPLMRGRTSLIITTDHGRGAKAAGPGRWHHHGSGLDERGVPHPADRWAGSDQSWAAVLPAQRFTPTPRAAGQCATSGQVAATAAAALGLDYRRAEPRAAIPLGHFGR